MKTNIKGKYLIIDGKKQLTKKEHPDNSKIDKKWIAELFVKSLKKAEILKPYYGSKGSRVPIFVINTHTDKSLNICFDTTDCGGTQHRYKISIPTSWKSVRTFIQKNDFYNGDSNFLVVNIYRTLNKNFVPSKEIIWLIIKPDEIYNSKTFKDAFYKGEANGSSRWVTVDDILNLIKNNKNFALNKKSNVYIVRDVFLNQFFRNKLNKELAEIQNKHQLDWIKCQLRKIQKSQNEYERDKLKESIRICARTIFSKKMRSKQNMLINSSISNPAFLIASHIRPVYDIIDDNNLSIKEKFNQIIDENNGILIPVYLDVMFDKNFVSFDDKWQLLVPTNFDFNNLKDFKSINFLQPLIKNKMNSEKYLKRHREITLKKRGDLLLYKELVKLKK